MAARFLKLEKMNTLKEISDKIEWHNNEVFKLQKTVRSDAFLKSLLQNIETIFGVSEEDIKSKSRKRDAVLGRNAFIYILRYVFGYTVEDIGEIVNRDHSTVCVSCKVYLADIQTVFWYKEKVSEVLNLPINK